MVNFSNLLNIAGILKIYCEEVKGEEKKRKSIKREGLESERKTGENETAEIYFLYSLFLSKHSLIALFSSN